MLILILEISSKTKPNEFLKFHHLLISYRISKVLSFHTNELNGIQAVFRQAFLFNQFKKHHSLVTRNNKSGWRNSFLFFSIKIVFNPNLSFNLVKDANLYSMLKGLHKGGPQIGLSAVIGSPRSPQSTYRVHTLTIESLLHDLHVIFGIFKIGGH